MEQPQSGKLNIDRLLTVAFTGHRAETLPWRADETAPSCIRLKQRLTAVICSLYDEGKRVFLSGMAAGFDTYAAEAVLELSESLPDIRLVCVFPCPSADPRAARIAEKAHRSILLSPEYCAGCMQLRNRYLIDNSSAVLACWDRRAEGGTYSTLLYANEKLIRIFLLAP